MFIHTHIDKYKNNTNKHTRVWERKCKNIKEILIAYKNIKCMKQLTGSEAYTRLVVGVFVYVCVCCVAGADCLPSIWHASQCLPQQIRNCVYKCRSSRWVVCRHTMVMASPELFGGLTKAFSLLGSRTLQLAVDGHYEHYLGNRMHNNPPFDKNYVSHSNKYSNSQTHIKIQTHTNSQTLIKMCAYVSLI